MTIEELVVKYLNDNLTGGIEAFAETPENPASKFVIIEKTSSGRVNYINSATIALQSYAPTMLDAIKLNEEVKAIMDNMVVLPEISKAAFERDYNFTDPNKKQYRYQAIYELTHYLA